MLLGGEGGEVREGGSTIQAKELKILEGIDLIVLLRILGQLYTSVLSVHQASIRPSSGSHETILKLIAIVRHQQHTRKSLHDTTSRH